MLHTYEGQKKMMEDLIIRKVGENPDTRGLGYLLTYFGIGDGGEPLSRK